MQLLDRTLDTPAENLALDEALLEHVETAADGQEVLRIWESSQYVAVLGRSSRAGTEINLSECESLGIPVVRRSSGGAAVLIGPGCLIYSVVLSHQTRPQLRMIEQAHRFVLGIVAAAVSELIEGVEMSGTSDLTRAGRKFSGNSIRCKRDQLLYHGTLLYDFQLELIARCLRTPPRQPEYRADRSHADFVCNLSVPANQLRAVLARRWCADRLLAEWPRERTTELAARKYSDRAWTFCR